VLPGFGRTPGRYYDWQKRSGREQRDAQLVSALKQIRREHPDYGVQSMIDELACVPKPSYGKGYRVCRDYGLLTKRRRLRRIGSNGHIEWVYS